MVWLLMGASAWVPLIFILAVVVLILLWAINRYNQMISMSELVDNAMSQIAIQAESRWDALSNLMEATKRYESHEANTLTEIVKNRNKITREAPIASVREDDQLFREAMRSIDVVVEQYPDLKASQIYQNVMDAVKQYENQVRHSRMIYNDTVTKFNRLIKTFPNSIIANIKGFFAREYLQVAESKQEMPKW